LTDAKFEEEKALSGKASRPGAKNRNTG